MSSFDYVNNAYQKTLKRGSVVTVPKNGTRVRGVATRATHHVYVRIDGEKASRPWHPHDVEQVEEAT